MNSIWMPLQLPVHCLYYSVSFRFFFLCQKPCYQTSFNDNNNYQCKKLFFSRQKKLSVRRNIFQGFFHLFLLFFLVFFQFFTISHFLHNRVHPIVLFKNETIQLSYSKRGVSFFELYFKFSKYQLHFYYDLNQNFSFSC